MAWEAVITNAGDTLLKQWVTEKTLHISGAAAGTGRVPTISLMSQSQLAGKKQDASILSKETVTDGIRLKLQITAPETGYGLSQYGIFGYVDEQGEAEPSLIAIFQNDKDIPVPSRSDSPDFVYTFYATLAVANTGELEVSIDTSALVTLGAMQTYVDSAVAKLVTDDTLNERVNELQRYADDAAAGALDGAKSYTDDKVANIPTPDVSGQIAEHNSSPAAHTDLREELGRVRAIAEGRSRGVVFRDYAELVSKLNSATADDYAVGDSLLVGTTDVPDLWVYAIAGVSSAYTYSTDDALVAALAAGPVQMGLFYVSELETEKVDVQGAINTHNRAEDAHPDIRAELQTVRNTANAANDKAAEAVGAAKTAQDAADAALQAVTDLTHTIEATPSQNGTLTYTGGKLTPSWNSYDPDKMDIGGQVDGTDAGEYKATFAPKAGYHWAGGGEDAVTVSWRIDRAVITDVPVQSGALTYTGDAQTPNWTGYDAKKMDWGGDTSGTEAKTYSATFTPNKNHQWADDSGTGAKTVKWSIGRADITVTPSQSGTLTYTGSLLTPDWTGYDENKMTIGGDTSATPAGSYQAQFTPKSNYQWSGGSTAAKSVSWLIGRADVSLPSQDGTLTYTGDTLVPKWIGYDAAKMTWGGATSGITANSYIAKFTPTANYQWAGGGGTGTKDVTWVIGKAACTITLNKSSLSLGDSASSGTVEVTRPGDGAITAQSNALGVATVSVKNNIVTVTAVANGSAVITVKVAEGTNHKAATDKTFSVSVSFANVFGVCWTYSNSSPALARMTKSGDPNKLATVNITTDPKPAVGTGSGSSPFDSYAPWKDMVEYNIINNAVSYKKGMSGFSRSNYDTVVYIPKFWYCIKDDSTGQKRYYYISDKAKSGFTEHPGSGKYVGRYNTANSSGYVSKTGLAPAVSMTRAAARTNSKAKGSKWGQYDFASWCAVWLLYLVEFANWDSQSKIGRGYADSHSSAINSGGTDGMSYHTGRPSGTDGSTAVQYRWIENPWGNVFEWIDGVNFSGGTVYVCTNRANYADDTDSGYTNVGTKSQTDGYIKSLGYSSTAPWTFFPTNTGGSETTYLCDYAYYSSSGRVLCAGGNWSNGSNAGLFYFYADSDSSSSNSNIGARLLFYP